MYVENNLKSSMRRVDVVMFRMKAQEDGGGLNHCIITCRYGHHRFQRKQKRARENVTKQFTGTKM
jgi:hypothetical protein